MMTNALNDFLMLVSVTLVKIPDVKIQRPEGANSEK